MEHRAVEPCAGCARHIRETETVCPFCGAAHAPGPPVAPPPRAPTRAMLAAWAGVFVAACGGGKAPEAQTQTQTQTVPQGGAGGESGGGDVEVSCGAANCRSRRPPYECPEDQQPCPAPPYGAPPMDDTIV